jgi:hypothetical protein
VITLLYGDHGPDFRRLGIRPRAQPAITIKQLGDAVVALTEALKALEVKLLDDRAGRAIDDNT